MMNSLCKINAFTQGEINRWTFGISKISIDLCTLYTIIVVRAAYLSCVKILSAIYPIHASLNKNCERFYHTQKLEKRGVYEHESNQLV